jgi:rod shape-determining protein MreC
MYGIITFIRKNYFALLFFALEFLSFYFVLRNNYYHEARFFDASNNITGSVNRVYSGFTYYFGLKTVNRELEDENTRLKNLLSLKEKDTETSSVQVTANHKILTGINSSFQNFAFLQATVIDNSANFQDNYIMLDKGSKDGVVNGSGVMCPTGVAGIIINVSNHYSIAMSVLHRRCKLSVMHKKGGAFGTLSWNEEMGFRHALLSEIPMSEKLSIGDTIITSGYSAIFPRGIPVGTIETITPINNLYFYSLKVKLFSDFHNLQYVNVIIDMMKKERDGLKDSVMLNNDTKERK